MAVLSNAIDDNLVSADVWRSRQADAAESVTDEDSKDEELSEDERAQFEIIRRCLDLYNDSKKAREPFENFDQAWKLFTGDVWPQKWPGYRAKITVNRVRAIVTFIAAVMTDNKPRFSVDPLVPGSEDASDLLRRLLDADWDRNDMQQKLAIFVLYGLIWGTAFIKMTYDPFADGGRGKHMAHVVAPYRVFTNRTATCIEDAEHIIHVDEQTMGWVKRNFPDRARAVYGVRGMTVSERDEDRDFVREGDTNDTYKIVTAQKVDGNITKPQVYRNHAFADVDVDTIEIMECWLRDETLEPAQRQKVVRGKPVTEPIIGDDGVGEYETVGYKMAFSEIDGKPFFAPVRRAKTKPVMESYWRAKYPNGRLVLIAGGRVLLRDIPVPFQTDGFPWAMWKDYDIGAFWGQGETVALWDLAVASNGVLSRVYDILGKIGDPTYKMLKTAGVNAATIKNKAGSIILMDDLKAIEPLGKPDIPPQFIELYNILNKAMAEVSGVNEAVMGAMPAANTAFATIDQLQESGSATIRGKVRNLETGITRMGRLRLSLIQQFDARSAKGMLRERVPDMPAASPESGEGEMGFHGSQMSPVQPAANVEVRFREYSNADLQGQVEFSVQPISSLASSPSGLWTKWMQLLDKHVIDRRWFLEKFRIEGWRGNLQRMEATEKINQAQEAAAKSASKSKPGPSAKSNRKRPAGPPPAPTSHTPTAYQRSQVR